MKLEDQVVSLELSKRLKELGVKQESWFWWNVPRSSDANGLPKPMVSDEENWGDYDNFPAFTVAEIGEKLPREIVVGARSSYLRVTKKSTGMWCVFYLHLDKFGDETEISEDADTEADARAKMLIYLLENKLIPA